MVIITIICNAGLVSAFDESGSGVVYLYEQQTVIGQESAGAIIYIMKVE